MKKEEFFEQIKGKVIVSCQAVPGEPLYVEEKSIMYLMARAAQAASAMSLPLKKKPGFRLSVLSKSSTKALKAILRLR